MKALTPTERTQRYNLLRALETFAQQRPGIDPRNYISPGCWDYYREDVANYRRECRQVTQDLRDFRVILAAVERSEITAAEILAATRAYSGRLEIIAPLTPDRFEIRYCTGQYFPTEYRRAACAVLAQALWDYYREDVQGHPRPGDKLREKFARMFSRRIAKRYFN